MLIHDNIGTQCKLYPLTYSLVDWQKDTQGVGVRGTVAALPHLLTKILVALPVD